jgi:putative glutamine amidotransferase
MRRPVVGVIGSAYRIERSICDTAGRRTKPSRGAEVAGALPLMFAAAPDITDIGALLDAVDGIVLTGARANVHPARFGTEPDCGTNPLTSIETTWRWHCRKLASPAANPVRYLPRLARDERGIRRLATSEIRELPGRMNHRMPRLESGEIHPDTTVVSPTGTTSVWSPAGCLPAARLRDHPRQFVARSRHPRTGETVIVEGVAEDGTIEAIRIADAPGFALGVQWHAEYDPQRNPINRALFQAFGEALLAHRRAN